MNVRAADGKALDGAGPRPAILVNNLAVKNTLFRERCATVGFADSAKVMDLEEV
jgi:hypothetical protein